uniref:Uncharacterized protein n=1 Tax=Arundo donax TaxID=35708 RepID=A0A0A8Y2B3_ARUDO
MLPALQLPNIFYKEFAMILFCHPVRNVRSQNLTAIRVPLQMCLGGARLGSVDCPGEILVMIGKMRHYPTTTHCLFHMGGPYARAIFAVFS